MEWILVVMSAALGAVFASYGGVVIERGWRGSNDGRSRCVCGHELAWFENIPVISWVALRGRARCCNAGIPVWYVRSEAAWALGGAVLGWMLGWPGAGATVAAVLVWAGVLRSRRGG